VRDHIFEAFYTTKASDQGTGLGLPTVSAILQAHGGTIDVETVPSRGTTFTVFLPSQDRNSHYDICPRSELR
jgi:two-component system, cell cycle sensor histidine kinase and response regulator CckA